MYIVYEYVCGELSEFLGLFFTENDAKCFIKGLNRVLDVDYDFVPVLKLLGE